MSMKAKLGQNPSQNKSFVPGTPSNNKCPDVSSAINARSTTMSCPTTTVPILTRTAVKNFMIESDAAAPFDEGEWSTELMG